MNKTADRTVALDKGRVDVYTKNGVTLYAYQTRDLIDNEVFVLAKKGRGVVIELPCFFDNIRELTDFLKSKGVTVEAKFVAYHAAGASFLPEVPAYGTESSVAYNTTGGGAGLVANFKNAFGDSFDPAICEVDHVLEEGEIELAGIRFVVKPNAEAFDLEILEINCVYTHMMGHDCHSRPRNESAVLHRLFPLFILIYSVFFDVKYCVRGIVVRIWYAESGVISAAFED